METKTITWESQVALARENLFQTVTTNRKLQPRRPPKAEFRPTKARRLDQVNPELLDLFKKLANGMAAWPLFLYGPVGAGKTCSCLAMSDIAATSWFGTVEDLCDITVTHAAKPWAEGSDVVYRNDSQSIVTTSALVVLDEIGARQKVTDLEYSSVKSFADERELGFGRVAIYISNCEPDAISRIYDDRIASRLLCGTWFKLDGADRRGQA